MPIVDVESALVALVIPRLTWTGGENSNTQGWLLKESRIKVADQRFTRGSTWLGSFFRFS